ncbi:MAG: AraC-like DNA-binding protein [Polaribacter sp.]|jgi:AraC-like DNA-binding protein
MLVNRNIINLYGQKLFELAQLTTPFRTYNDLSNEACFLHILEGRHNHYSLTEKIEAKQDGGILMKCGNFIFEPVPNKTNGATKLIAIHFFPEVLKKLFKDNPPKFLFTSKSDADVEMTYIDGNEIINHYMQSISLLFDNPSLAEESILELKLREIILILSKVDSTGVREIMNNLFNPTTVVFKEVIEAHLYSDLAVDDLAKLTNNSLTAFKRKFKEIYQTSPANYIKDKRLEKASKLLTISDLSISDISFECAFNDLAHFSNSFKAKFDLTPSEYRLAQNSK